MKGAFLDLDSNIWRILYKKRTVMNHDDDDGKEHRKMMEKKKKMMEKKKKKKKKKKNAKKMMMMMVSENCKYDSYNKYIDEQLNNVMKNEGKSNNCYNRYVVIVD